MGFKRSETFISNIFHVFHTISQLKLSVTSEIFLYMFSVKTIN